MSLQPKIGLYKKATLYQMDVQFPNLSQLVYSFSRDLLVAIGIALISLVLFSKSIKFHAED